jgi:hypothetical protein
MGRTTTKLNLNAAVLEPSAAAQEPHSARPLAAQGGGRRDIGCPPQPIVPEVVILRDLLR